MASIEFDRVLVKGANTIGTVKIVMVKGDKGDVGYPTDAQVETAVNEWLNDHPEATTTVQDGSITKAKLSNDVKAELEKIDTKADAIVKTASGEIASFTDGGDDLPVKSLKVNIVPKQSGSGDPSPSNVRPISGYSDVNVKRIGKNFLKVNGYDLFRQYGYYDRNELTDSSVILDPPTIGWSNIWVAYKNVPIGTPITLSGTYTNPNGNGARPTIALGSVDPTDTSFSNYADIVKETITEVGTRTFSLTATIPSGRICALRITASNTNDISMVTQVFKVENMQIELGSTATAYEPYEGESKSISLGQTVYGGNLEVVSGKLTITKVLADMGTLPWTLDSRYANKQFYCQIRQAKTFGDILCSTYKTTTRHSWNSNVDLTIDTLEDHYFIAVDNSYATVSAFKSAMSGQKLCYELATPTEIQLTPTEVKTLLGNNNIWSDGGTVEVEYRADTTLAYNELLSLIASLS